ncbi:MAG TPA: GNAT family N-acetyltransferase [Streptosporangiaceae bacterium]
MITCTDIDSLDKAEQLRILRNECAEWMTNDTSRISADKQREFYRARVATGQVEGFLMCDDGEPVAYGLIIWDSEGRAWSSTGVAVTARGRGIGREVTIENVRRAHARGVPMWAEVRADNAGQQKICRSIGYTDHGQTERNGHLIDVMVCPHPAMP